MDRKAVIILVLSGALFLLWLSLVHRVFPPIPLPAGQTNKVSTAANQSSPKPATNAASTPDSIGTTSAPLKRKPPDEPEQTVTLEDANVRYTFTSYGGGIKVVELKRYPATVDCRSKKTTDTNRLATLNTRAPAAALTLVGGTEIEGDGLFTLSKTPDGVRAEKILPSGLRVVKDFQLSTNYVLHVTVRLENPTGQPSPVPARELVIGTATPIGQQDETMNMGFEWYDGTNRPDQIGEAWFANRS